MQPRQELYVKKIRDGTVIDHITPGFALDVLKILRINGKRGEVVTAAINVESKHLHHKDIVKIQDRELKPSEVDKIALIAPNATINIIRNFEVTSKKVVELPSTIRGIIKCDNPSCVSNSREPVEPDFGVEGREPIRLRCHYCGHVLEREDILKQFWEQKRLRRVLTSLGKIALISDRMTATYFKVTGVSDSYAVKDREEAERAFRKVTSDETISLVMITEPIFEWVRPLAERSKKEFPLVVSIPPRGGSKAEVDTLAQLIKRTVGIDLKMK